jgi:hypothetical protein
MRDVRRYAAAIYGTVRALDGQVALADVLALEAIRVFLPDVFHRMHGALDALTNTSDSFASHSGSAHLKSQIDGMIEAAGKERGGIVRSLIERLFPAAQQHIGGSHYGAEWKGRWLRERRVAHNGVLRLHLEHVVGEDLQAFTHAEKAWALMTDREALESYLGSLKPEQAQQIISSLEAFEDQFRPEHVVPGSAALLNLLPMLPEQRRGMFEPDARLTVGRVVYRLVRALKDPKLIESAVRDILLQVPSLSSQLEPIEDVGYREGAGHKLVSEAAAKALEKDWRAAVRLASPEQLASERSLLRVLLVAKREAEPDEPAFTIPAIPAVTYAMLRSARGETLSQSVASRAVRRSPRLAWDALVELYGDEATLRQRIGELKASPPEEVGDLLELADKYLSGWRPKDFDKD